MLTAPPDSAHCPPAARTLAGQGALARAQEEARQLMARENLTDPISAFQIHPVDRVHGDIVEVAGQALHAPALAQWGARLTSLLGAACTVGPALEARVSALFASRQPGLAMALDTLGTDLLFRLSDRLYARVRRDMRKQGLKMAPPENPGDGGLALEAQRAVLTLAGGDPKRLWSNDSGMLQPVKSLTFVAALGADLPDHTVVPRCVRCSARERCTLRQQ